MYNTNFNCTYHKLMYVKNPELIDKSQTIYRHDFLKCLNLTEYNDDLVNSVVTELFKKIEHNNIFSIILEKLEKSLEKTTTGMLSLFYSNEENKDKSTIFMFLLSYDYLFLFNECIKELFENKLSENSYHYKLLLEKIEFPDFFQNEHIKELTKDSASETSNIIMQVDNKN